MNTPPVDYIELNLSNYDAEDVAQLNEWAIWAQGEIDYLRGCLRQFGDHLPSCRMRDHWVNPCDCGFQEAT